MASFHLPFDRAIAVNEYHLSMAMINARKMTPSPRRRLVSIPIWPHNRHLYWPKSERRRRKRRGKKRIVMHLNGTPIRLWVATYSCPFFYLRHGIHDGESDGQEEEDVQSPVIGSYPEVLLGHEGRGGGGKGDCISIEGTM